MRGPLVGYLAVKVLGYWADLFVTVDDGSITAAARHAEAALDAIIADMRPGRADRCASRQSRRRAGAV